MSFLSSILNYDPSLYFPKEEYTKICKRCKAVGEWKISCSECKEAFYCCIEHQLADLIGHHDSASGCCQAIQENPLSVFLEILPTTTDADSTSNSEAGAPSAEVYPHIFATKQDGLKSLRKNIFGGGTLTPYRSQYSELLGWDIEIYSPAHILPNNNPVHATILKYMGAPLNRAGMLLASPLDANSFFAENGAYNNNNDNNKNALFYGSVFVTGRNRNGEALTQDSLISLLSFINDCQKGFVSSYQSDDAVIRGVVSEVRRYFSSTM